jgi:hypothetical protein
MNFQNRVLFSLDKVVLTAFLGGSFIYLNFSSEWEMVFAQSSVSMWGVLAITLGYWLASSLPTAWSWQPWNYRVHWWAISLPLLLFWVLYHQLLSAWWTADDPALLEYIHEVKPWTMLVSKTRDLFYAPLQPLSWSWDYHFFGLQPSGFYWHHLLSFSLVILLAYSVLSQFFPPLLASMIISLFITMVPTAHVAHHLMLRHYLEGFGLALLATGCYLRAIQAASRFYNPWAVIGSIGYLGASLAKEIYVPLPVILLTLPRGTFLQRLRQLWLWLVAILIYIGLRLYSMGWEDLLASYPERSTGWQDVLNLPTAYIKSMGWQTSWQWLPVGAVMVVLLIWIKQQPYSLGISSIVWLVAVLGPLLPILWRLIDLKYYWFMVAFLTSLACGLVWLQFNRWLTSRQWCAFFINAWFFAVFFANLLPTQREQFWLYQDKTIRHLQGQFLLNSDFQQTVLIDKDYYAAQSVVNLRKKILGQFPGPNWCPVDDCYCSLLYPGYTSWRYLNGQWQVEVLSPDNRCGKQAELSLQITLTSSTQLRWQLGPYTEQQGTYSAWVVAASEDFDLYRLPRVIPAQGLYTFEQKLTMPIKVLVKYQSLEGWDTYTPFLVVDPQQVNAQGVVEVNWHRLAQPANFQQM